MFKPRKKDLKRVVRRPAISTAEDDDSSANSDSNSKSKSDLAQEAGYSSDASVGTAPTPVVTEPTNTTTTTATATTAAAAVSGNSKSKKMRKKVKGSGKGADVKVSAKPVLSFGHEDEDDGMGFGAEDGKRADNDGGGGAFRVKKSKASKAISRASKENTKAVVEQQLTPSSNGTKSKPSAAASSASSWHNATAGLYTAEGLAALRSSQAFTPKPSTSREHSRGGRPAGNEQGRAATEHVFAGDDAEMVHEAERKGGLGKESLDEEKMVRMKGEWDATLAAREAREKERGKGGEDFIPLDGKVTVPGAGSGDAGVGLEETGEPDDEEQQRWEEEQVRRGATRPAAKPQLAKPAAWEGNSTSLAVAGGWGERGAAVERPRFLGVAEMQKALREAGKQLRETHERNERQLQVLVSELETQAKTEDKLAKEQAEAASRFTFFQRTRNSLSDLCGMLREKKDMLSEVEQAIKLLFSRRLEARLAVRLQDQEDEILDAKDAGVMVTNLGPYRPSPSGPLAQSPPLSSSSSSSSPILSSSGQPNQHPSDAGDRARRRADREKRRRRFRNGGMTGSFSGGGGRGSAGGGGGIDGISVPWGEKERADIQEALGSGGDESEAEEARFAGRVGNVLEAADMVMEDVDDDVKSLPAVKHLFEQWKRDHGEEYAQAYCTLTIPDILAPFVRLELLRWDPLTGTVAESRTTAKTDGNTMAVDVQELHADDGGGDGADGVVLERFGWYQTLMDFSENIPPPKSVGYGEEEDPDQNLVPQIVERVAVPLVAERLSTAYDAMSRRQTACVTAAVSDLLVYDPGAESLKQLLGGALSALQTAVRNLCLPIVGGQAAAAAAGDTSAAGRAAAVRLVRRQACRALKLLENCLAWQDLLSPQALVPLALGDLVSKRLVPSLRALASRQGGGGGVKGGGMGVRSKAAEEALALCERAVELLPVQWMERADAAPSLASIRILGRLFGEGLPVEAGGGGRRTGEAVERVVRLQIALGDEGAARALAQKHGLKIAS